MIRQLDYWKILVQIIVDEIINLSREKMKIFEYFANIVFLIEIVDCETGNKKVNTT